MEAKEIQAVIDWMNEWEQLKDTSIPMRFKEDFKPSSAVVGANEQQSFRDYIKQFKKVDEFWNNLTELQQEILENNIKNYAQSYNATKLPSITEIEIKSMAEDKYPSCEEWDEGACEGFQVGYKLGLLKESGLKEREGCEHNWKVHSFDGKPEHRFCPLCKETHEYKGGRWIRIIPLAPEPK